MRLLHKRVLLGVCGGIAAYKAVELLRRLMQEGASVQVVMTASATRFVTPLTFRTLSGFPVLTALYQEDLGLTGGDSDHSGVEHIEVVKESDLLVVAPATANTLAKAAWGLADDALSTVLLCARADILWAPAMNHRMWDNAVTQDNVARLRRLGHQFADPEDGWMACREHGKGRMAEVDTILERVVELIGSPQDLEGTRVLITAGGTEESIDPVRTLSNRSSGRMGAALATAALSRGAEVAMITGTMEVEVPPGVEWTSVRSASQMHDAASRLFSHCDVLVMAAAVADFRPARPSTRKLKREGKPVLELSPTPDILATLSANRKNGQILVGFALETDRPVEAAREKLKKKGADLIVLNRPEALGSESNAVTLIEGGRAARKLAPMPKLDAANRILDWVVNHRAKLRKRKSSSRSPSRSR